MPSATEPLTLTADERATLETLCAIARGPRRPGATRPGRAAARRWRLVRRGDGDGRLEFRHHREVENPLRSGPPRRVVGPPPRVEADDCARPQMEARILNWTRKPPPSGATHWSTRSLAKHLHVPHTLVQRVWQRAGLQPHRLERYMRSNDPAFESKAADIIGLYLNPPQHAAVFCVDEKTAIQALDRLDPVLPMSPGRAERHGFEYYRHGTLSLYAALDPRTGTVVGQTAARHTSADFVQFLATVVGDAAAATEGPHHSR